MNHREPFILESSLLPDLFDVLHGKEQADVAKTLLPALKHMKTLGKIKPGLPIAAPIEVKTQWCQWPQFECSRR